MTHLASTMLTVALALPLGGCAIGAAVAYVANAAEESGSSMVYAEYTGLRGHDAAVVVYADQVIRASQPRLVNRLTNAITRQVSVPEIGLTGIVPGPRILEFQYANPSWPAWTYEEMCEEFTVSRLIVVELREYRLHEPGNRHLWDGRATAFVGVYEAGTGSTDLTFTKTVTIRFPDETGFTRRELPEQAVAANLQQRLVNRIAWLMYDHEEPNSLEY